MKKNFSTDIIKRVVFLVCLFMSVEHVVIAQRFAVATGNWSGAIWATTAGGVAGSAATPTSADAVTINSAITVTVDIASAKCSSLTFTAASAASGVTLLSTDTLTVIGAITMNAVTTASVTTTLAVATGTLKAGSISIAGAAVATKKNIISVLAGGILNCSGNFNFAGGSNAAAAILSWAATSSIVVGGNLTSTGSCEFQAAASSPLTVGGNYAFSGTINSGTINLTFNGTGAQSITGTATFRSLIVNKTSGTATANTALTISANAGISVLSGALDLSTYAHSMTSAKPAITVSNGATLEVGTSQSLPATASNLTFGASSNMIYYGTNQYITGTTYGNLSLTGLGNDTVQLQAATVVAGILNISDGVTMAIDSNFTVDSSTNVGGGTSGGINFISTNGNSRVFTGLVTINTGAIWNNTIGRACTFKNGIINNGTFTVGGLGIQTFNTNNQALTGDFSIDHVTVNVISLTNNNNLTVSKALAGTGGLTNLGTLTIDSAATVVTIDGSASGNTVIFDGTVAQTVPGNTYYNLNCTGTGPFTFGTLRSVSIENVFNVGAGLYSSTNSTVNFSGTTDQTIPLINYDNLSLSGSGTKKFSGKDTITGNLSIVSPAIADLGNNNSLTNTLSFGSIGQNPDSYGGTGSIASNINATYFAPVSTGILNVTTVENSWIGGVSNDWNNPNNWSYGTVPAATTNISIAGTPLYQPVISVTSGMCNNISVASGDSLTVTNSTDTIYISGNFTNSGKFISASGTVVFNGKTQIVGSANFYNLTLRNNGIKSITADTVNGILSLEDSAFVTAAPVYGAAATLQYNTGLPRTTGVEWITPFTTTGGINITNAGIIKVSAAKVFNTGILSIQSGATFNDTTRVISGTGTFSLMAGGTLELAKAGGINGCFTLTTVILDPMANYVFNNSTAAITAMGAYLTAANNVTIADTLFPVTLSAGLAVSGTFSVIPGATFNVGTNVISGTGNFSLASRATLKIANVTGIDGAINTSGINYFNSAANYIFDGSAAQTTGSTMSATVNNITVNNASGVTLSGPVNINGALTFTNGKLSTSPAALLSINNITNTAIVTPTSSNYVNGPMVWTMASGTAYTYPVGNNNNYYPFAITPSGTAPQVEVQAFNTNSGGAPDNSTIHFLSSTEYWATNLISGSISGAVVGITRTTAINPYNIIGMSSSASGTYSTLHGTASTYAMSNSDNVPSLGYFVFASCVDTNKISATACDSYTLNSTTYTTSGKYYQSFTNKAGCDSIVALALIINHSTTGDTTATACNNFTWYGTTYTSSASPTHLLMSKAGCDSTVTLHLTINIVPNVTANASSSVCAGTSVTLNGGGADSYSWSDGVTDGVGFVPTATNTYTVTGTNTVTTCSNTATTTITVNPSPDLNTTLNGPTISSLQNGASYQWIDCNNGNQAIAGKTNQSFTATQDGNYAVIVTLNGCFDTSACVVVTTTGIAENEVNNPLRIYPNPSSGNFTIQSSGPGAYSIVNEMGQQIQTMNLSSANKYTLNVNDLANGIYFIVGNHNNGIVREKIVVAK